MRQTISSDTALIQVPNSKRLVFIDLLCFLLQALQEIANVQKTILQKWNVEFLQYLIQTYLPQNNCPPDMTQEYAMALEKMDNKTFKNYLKAFYAKAKT